MEAAERDPPRVSSRKEEARKEEAEDGGVRVIVGGSVSRETEIHPLPSSAGPWVLIGFWGQNRQESLAREMCANYSVTCNYENWCDRWYFREEAWGGCKSEMRQIS